MGQCRSISLAYVTMNAPHFADFVIETRTPIVEEGKELCELYHYSEVKSLPAKNTLHCIGDLPPTWFPGGYQTCRGNLPVNRLRNATWVS